MAVSNLSRESISKHEHLLLANEILTLRKTLKQKHEMLTKHIPEFDVLRHRLHALAKKGVKTLKPWHHL